MVRHFYVRHFQRPPDNFKTLKAIYMLMRLLYTHAMTKYVGKISTLKFQSIYEKTANKS